MNYYNPNLKQNARTLRKNMTEKEKKLWNHIRNKQLKGMQFQRQKVLGDYIVDFYCPNGKLVVELDGGQHFSDESIRDDKLRDEYLNRMGYTVLRFTNHEIDVNFENVLNEIFRHL